MKTIILFTISILLTSFYVFAQKPMVGLSYNYVTKYLQQQDEYRYHGKSNQITASKNGVDYIHIFENNFCEITLVHAPSMQSRDNIFLKFNDTEELTEVGDFEYYNYQTHWFTTMYKEDGFYGVSYATKHSFYWASYLSQIHGILEERKNLQ